MQLAVRQIAIRITAVCFFLICISGWIYDVPALVCCKRAIFGTTAAYMVATIMIKAMNIVIEKQTTSVDTANTIVEDKN